ncbi:hypothetical protein [Streptomyces sp. NPDC001404]|uniref:hypothetical protein n=1 Tax=Streptomyces sp. NPDC001404 TaxID=3364571 RepID=UPI0036BF1291
MSNCPPINAYAETALLWAILNDDTNEATRIIHDMLPHERTGLETQLHRVLGLLDDAR